MTEKLIKDSIGKKFYDTDFAEGIKQMKSKD